MRLLPILLLAAALQAGETPLGPVFEHLRLAPGVKPVEGSRGLDAAFPYLKGLTPQTLPRFVTGIEDVKQAAEAVRLFVAGTIVRDEPQAKRILATARELQKELEHLDVKVTDHRPKSYTPSAKKVEGGFEVSLVAFEMDRILQLVQVVAKVKRDGTVELERHPIVSGPMTSWQTAMLEMEDQEKIAAVMEAEKAMRAEAVKARTRYAAVLKPARDLDAAWAIARLALSLDEIEDLWGPPDAKMGSGLMIRGWKLADGTAMIVGAGGPRTRPTYVRHTRSIRSTDALHTLYAVPSRRR